MTSTRIRRMIKSGTVRSGRVRGSGSRRDHPDDDETESRRERRTRKAGKPGVGDEPESRSYAVGGRLEETKVFPFLFGRDLRLLYLLQLAVRNIHNVLYIIL